MLPSLLFVIFTMSIMLLVLRRDLRSILLFLAVSSISFFFYTITVYIAKKGGVSELTTLVLFGSNKIRQKLLYSVFTVNRLGFMMALGRYLSPYFLLLSALNMAEKLTKKNFFRLALPLLLVPVTTIITYLPSVFESFSNSEKTMALLVNFSKVWIVIYVLFSLYIMVREFILTKLSFFRIRFLMKTLIIFSLAIIYSLYFPQDPAQVYLFYRNEYMWMMGLWYLHRGFSSGLYYVVMLGSMMAGTVSIASLIRYFSSTFGEEVVEVKVRRESIAATRGVSMFVHGTKNDLLATRILLDKVQEKNPDDDDILRLISINTGLVSRLEKLNRAIKVNSIKLYPVTVSSVLGEAMKRKRESFPDYPVRVSGLDSSRLILADNTFLSEALWNIIQNAIEATRENGSNDEVEIAVEYGRMWAEIIISDRGKGIDKETEKHLWEPFRSSKNSSTNWGIGMYFTRLVVKRHMGSISFSPRKDGGTEFIVMLPLAGRNSDDKSNAQ